MDQNLINLALALTTNELLHNMAEVAGIQSKVGRLQAYIAKRPYKEMKLNINTRAKSYGISTVIFVIAVGCLYGLYSALNLGAETALQLIIAILLVTYFTTAIMVDRFHVLIEKVTRPFMKKK